jgi:hypothetical protein
VSPVRLGFGWGGLDDHRAGKGKARRHQGFERHAHGALQEAGAFKTTMRQALMFRFCLAPLLAQQAGKSLLRKRLR